MKGAQPLCLDCRRHRVGCHDPETCKAWAEYTAQAKAVQADKDRRRSQQALLFEYGKELHQRMERRSRNGR